MGPGPAVVVLGSVNLDLTVTGERLPRPGETVTGGRFERHHGGKGGNQSVAAARAGAEVRFVGAVGEDAEGDDLLTGLRAEGVDTEAVRRVSEAATGTALICVDATGENQIAVAPGANRHARAEREAVKGCALAVAQLEAPIEAVAEFFTYAHDAGAVTVLNAAPFQAAAAELVPLADVLVVNRDECVALQEIGAPIEGRAVVTTLGADGLTVTEPDGSETHFAGHPVEAVDTVGAGDAACGALAAALAAGAPLLEAAERANAAGALATTRPGARSAPTRAEVDALLRTAPTP